MLYLKRFVLAFVFVGCTSTNGLPVVDMVTIPGGCYIMGSATGDIDEFPPTEVEIDSFKIARFEVSQSLYKTVMGENPSYHKGARLPVESVSWEDANSFISKLNNLTGRHYRLPTEAEWEYVAKLCMMDPNYEYWFLNNSNGRSHRIGTLTASKLGIYDLIGNVNEWCMSPYDGCDYSGSVVCQLDSNITYAVFRGGGFNASIDFCRVENRNYVPSNTKNYAIGIRLAEDL